MSIFESFPAAIGLMSLLVVYLQLVGLYFAILKVSEKFLNKPEDREAKRLIRKKLKWKNVLTLSLYGD